MLLAINVFVEFKLLERHGIGHAEIAEEYIPTLVQLKLHTSYV